MGGGVVQMFHLFCPRLYVVNDGQTDLVLLQIELIAASMRTECFLFVFSFFHIILCRLRQTRKKKHSWRQNAAILTSRLLNNPAINVKRKFFISYIYQLGQSRAKVSRTYRERKKVFLICTDQLIFVDNRKQKAFVEHRG